ncbi:hypothetical protein KCV87_27100 [Actinosynnema pretiosum subsp. pretiosum]|uniref:Uncharacterized protein n=2 Tax=Actinosynnema TaxID=40566 RepID=C6WDE1_ACTMD|nr:hypothetical protein [Actinosynnema mirum]ACU39578.1 hypothetical protein Amir_5765 [Actinosynnema mirum DSM 43827]AXX33087.1 hypothetical protein APASM_5722 [Actinosynnema pretiosum subsp. pretiosum]QUF03065.1 hypothetical protein KCV87_27100 [Actinosynnema pretiosum subsp. pretiosum]
MGLPSAAGAGPVSGRPLYLHLLDRELAGSVGFRLTPRVFEHVVKCLLLGTTSPLCCGISLVWENGGLGEREHRLLSALAEHDSFQPISYQGTLDEFVSSRQRLYRHDAHRYPLYFGRESARLELVRPTLHKDADTTEALQGSLLAWAGTGDGGGSRGLARRVVLRALLKRRERAITFSLFQATARRVGGGAEVEGEVKRRISTAYTRHYLDFLGGDLPTGVPGLSRFDGDLSADFPLFDVPLLTVLLRGVGLGAVLDSPWHEHERWWLRFLVERGTGAHWALVWNLGAVLGAVAALRPPARGSGEQFTARAAMRAALGGLCEVEGARAGEGSLVAAAADRSMAVLGRVVVGPADLGASAAGPVVPAANTATGAVSGGVTQVGSVHGGLHQHHHWHAPVPEPRRP